MDNPRGALHLSPMRLLVTSLILSLLCLPLFACQGKESAPKSSAGERRLGLSKEHKAPATTTRPGVRAPERSAPQVYQPWQRQGFPTAAPPTYVDQMPLETYRAYEPLARVGPTQYQGYRFRPLEPGQTASPQSGPTFGGWGVPDRGWNGLERREQRASYGEGYAQPSPHFRPPREQDLDRWGLGAPYGWSRYGELPYAPVPQWDAYGFEPGGW